MISPVVELSKVSIRFGSTPILVGVDLRVEPGEVVGVAGPNGAGKTTLLGVVSTLLPPTGGEGRVLGAHLGSRGVLAVRSRIGWSAHDPGLYPELTLAENLRLAARLGGTPDGAAEEALERVGLGGAAHRRAALASNGMQRRADLARLIMTDPDLVLLDEAHAGLDSAAEAIVAALLARCRAQGKAAVLVSHDAGRLTGDVDRVVRIEAGAVVS